jgi:hypothetical protein
MYQSALPMIIKFLSTCYDELYNMMACRGS